MAERLVQVKLVTVSADVEVGLEELNELLAEMQEASHEIHSVNPVFSSGQVWQITFMKDNRGTGDARGITEETPE